MTEYEPGYDDYHDIFIQRWRTEDRPWQVICVNRLTKKEREVPYGTLNFDGEQCQDPFEYKMVIGQGNPTGIIPSRFLDPNNPVNNVCVPGSVPGVKAQPWLTNYGDGVCGKRKINDDLQMYDPSLPDRDLPNRGNCSNIVDNKIHPALPDQRVGSQVVLERRRAKFIAVSKLTEDYLDTTGAVAVLEGELDGGEDLIALVWEFKKGTDSDLFQWSSALGAERTVASTYQPPITDSTFSQQVFWEGKQRQYEEKYGDKGRESAHSVLDGWKYN